MFSFIIFLSRSITGNRLASLPENLDATLDNLETLDLSDNNMREVPKSMCDFPKLDEVDLQVCIIT